MIVTCQALEGLPLLLKELSHQILCVFFWIYEYVMTRIGTFTGFKIFCSSFGFILQFLFLEIPRIPKMDFTITKIS